MFDLDQKYTEVVIESDSSSVESRDSAEDLVYNTVCEGRRQRTIAYRYQKDQYELTIVEDSDNNHLSSKADEFDTDVDNERSDTPAPDRAMEQLAAAMAQLARTQQQTMAQMVQIQQQMLVHQQQMMQQQDQRLQQQEQRMEQQGELMIQVAREPRQRRDIMMPWKDTDDIEAYLGTFERAMARVGKDEEEWTQELVPLLSGRVLTVYHSLEYDVDFPTLKEALLTHFGVTVMGSHLRFRQSKFHDSNNIREHLNKLRPLLRRWLVPPVRPDVTDADYITEILQRQENKLMMEQIRNGMSYNLQRHIDARNPTTVEDLCQCVEAYQLQHAKSGPGDRKSHSYTAQQRRTGNTAQNTSTASTPIKNRQTATQY